MSGYGIRVTIAGVGLNVWADSELDPGGPLAINEVRIPWGRESIYEHPDPMQATVVLLDRDGRYVDASVVGQQLEVYITGEAAGDRRVFRGWITDAPAELIALQDGSAYVVTVTATDPTGDLGRYIGPGDYYNGQTDFGSVTLGSGAYVMSGGSTRVNQLMNQGIVGPPTTDVPAIVSGIEIPPGTAAGHAGDPTYALYVGPVEALGNVTVLDVIREAFRLSPLGWVNYDPAIDFVRIGKLAPSAPLQLVLNAGRVVVAPASVPSPDNAPLMLDAQHIEVPDGYTLRSAPDNAIDRITIPRVKQVFTPDGQPVNNVQFYKQVMVRTVAWRNTDRFDPARHGVRSLDYGLTFGGLEQMYQNPTYNYGTNGVGWLIEEVVKYINDYNGTMQLPKLKYRLDLDPDVTDDKTEMLINPRTHARPLIFSGSVFNGVPSVPSQVQYIGGTVGFSKGSWWAEMMTAPATSRSAPALTIGQLASATNTATLNDFDPTIRLADLGLVSTGLA